MKRVVIVGGGFAGLAAASRLGRHGREVEVTLVDRKETFDFLPMLPDVVGERTDARFLVYPLRRACERSGVTFRHASVESVDLDGHHLTLADGEIPFDYLLLSCGSVTNFRGRDDIRRVAFALDDVADARRLHDAVEAGDFETVVMAGGGYTGLETATNIRRFLRRHGRDVPVTVVEAGKSVVSHLPEWMRESCREGLRRMRIEMVTDTLVDEVSGGDVRLSNGRTFANALAVWSAGVKTPGVIQSMSAEKDRQGRLDVDGFLRVNETCFAAGDVAGKRGDEPALRMGVQFSRVGGFRAAENILCTIRGQSLKRFDPVDPGYVVPLANDRSCGNVLGVPVKGFPATFLHYFMSILRSIGFTNRWGIARKLLAGEIRG